MLPRHRRRRCMSWNFHRLPQSLRPRALKESKSNKLIFESNKPLKSRKSIRCACNDKKQRFISKRCIVEKLYVKDQDNQMYCCKYVQNNQNKIIRYSLRLDIQNLPFYDRSTSLYICFHADNIIKDDNIQQVGQYSYLYKNQPFEYYQQLQLGITYIFSYNIIKNIFNNIKVSDYLSFIVFGDLKQCLKQRNFKIEENNNILIIQSEQFRQLRRLTNPITTNQQVFQMLQIDYIKSNHFDQNLINKLVRLLKPKQQIIDLGNKEIQNNKQNLVIQMDKNNLYAIEILNNVFICFQAQTYRNEGLYYTYKHFIPIGLQERRYHLYNQNIKDFSFILPLKMNQQKQIKQQQIRNQKLVCNKQFKKWLFSNNMSLQDIKFDKQTQKQSIQPLINLDQLIKYKYKKQLEANKDEILQCQMYINTLGQTKGLSTDFMTNDEILNQIALL